MEHFIGKAAERAGDALEGAIKKACGVKSKDTKKKGGGVLSFLEGGKDKDDKDHNKKGGLFSFGDDKKKDNTEKNTGFKGLFSEQEGASGGSKNEEMPRFDEGATPGAGPNDGDIFNDLMDVAEEMSKGK